MWLIGRISEGENSEVERGEKKWNRSAGQEQGGQPGRVGTGMCRVDRVQFGPATRQALTLTEHARRALHRASPFWASLLRRVLAPMRVPRNKIFLPACFKTRDVVR